MAEVKYLTTEEETRYQELLVEFMGDEWVVAPGYRIRFEQDETYDIMHQIFGHEIFGHEHIITTKQKRKY